MQQTVAQKNKHQSRSFLKTMRPTKYGSSASVNIMYLPALILFCVFIIYPFIKGIQISFTDWDGYSQAFHWVGLRNYASTLADPNTWTVVRNTLIYGIGSTILQNILGLLYALLLNQKIRARGLTRTIVYLPVIISPLIMGYIWYFIFRSDGGALNDVLHLLGQHPVDLLGMSGVNVWVITLVNTYQFVGIAMIIFLAGLQSIPRSFYEAAEIDGATAWNRFWNVTLPLLMPSITVNIVLNVVGGLKLFDVIVAMTNGGPGYASQSLSTMMYQTYFARQQAGSAATLGVLMFVLIAIIGLSALIYLRRKEQAE